MSSIHLKEFSPSEEERVLAEAPIPVLFRKYAIPGVIGLLFVGLQTIIDGIVLGNFVGSNALASVSLILPCYSFMAAVAVVMGVGCQTLISICLGKRDRMGASDALKSAFFALMGMAVIISTMLYFFAPHMARLLGANEILLGGSVSYMRSLVPFFPIVVAMFFADYTLKALGRPIYAMLVMTLVVLINIGLDLLFVACWDMGIGGAGLSTGIAFSVGACCSLPFLFKKKGLVSLKSGKFKLRLVWQMFYNGSSEGMSELSSGVSTLLFNLAIMHYLGESGVAAFTAINYVFFIGITLFLGISDGIIPIISFNFGAGKWERIRKAMTLAVKTNLTIGIILFLALLIFGRQIISLFFKEGEDAVMEIAAHGTLIYAFAFLMNGLNVLSASYFTALANAKISIIISLLRGLVFVAIGIAVFPLIWGIDGIWLAVPSAELATLGISYLLVRRSLKKTALMQTESVFS